MRKRSLISLLTALVLILGAATVYAARDNDNARVLTVTGKNYCVACTLKSQGAKGSCSTKGCQHALRVKEAKDADGTVLEDMEGWTLHYLANDAAADYLKGHHYEEVTVTGTVFQRERVIDLSAS
jgi:hypothetical protein